MVAALGETTGTLVLPALRDRMLRDRDGRRILRERPLVSTASVDLARLRALPTSTFGGAYVRFLDSQHVTPDSRENIKYIDDPELAYVMLRYRQVHDFWHALLDMPVTVEAEIAVKWFEFVQTGLPVAMLSALVGPLRLTAAERERLFGHFVPWAVQSASNCKFLMAVMYEDLFEQDLEQVRRDLGFLPPPPEVIASADAAREELLRQQQHQQEQQPQGAPSRPGDPSSAAA
nr:Ubiquinone biosynthesis protein [Polyrhizophydium stewartii]